MKATGTLVILCTALLTACSAVTGTQLPSTDLDGRVVATRVLEIGGSVAQSQPFGAFPGAMPGAPRASVSIRSANAIAARGNDAVVYDQSSRLLLWVNLASTGAVTLSDRFTRVGGVYLAMDRTVYLADTDGRRIVRLDSWGNVINTYEASGDQGFTPVDVVIAQSSGAVAAVDLLHGHVIVFAPTGAVATAIEIPVPVSLALPRPGVFAASGGMFFLLDPGQRELVLFDVEGQLHQTIALHQMTRPVALAVDECNRVFMVDGSTARMFVMLEGGEMQEVVLQGRQAFDLQDINDMWIDGAALYLANGSAGITGWRIDPQCP